MSELKSDGFLEELNEVLGHHLSNEQFGVSELASELGMSRSNLLRKIKKLTNLSASQYIRQIRLQHAMKLLSETSMNVSEISFKVGFGSTSYFIKCFREHYGHPPGEVGKREEETELDRGSSAVYKWYWLAIPVVVFALFLGWWFLREKEPEVPLEKSIAVLPFKNDSNDSSNVYFINGVMESILTHLQRIEDLSVISRTSVEKYRYTDLTIPEIAKELNVSYFVEGSGQKAGDQIQLYIQLIEASGDRHLWAEQYRRKLEDIFNIQQEVAKSIADNIEVVIQPVAIEQIEKVPTESLVAWDHYLKGMELFMQQKSETTIQAIKWFKMAIDEDPDFSSAYAMTAVAYHYLDVFTTDRQYSMEVSDFADKALLLDPKSSLSLVAKATFYMYEGNYSLAVPYLERALQFNPNDADVLNILGDIYARYIPNTQKYLEYALKGLKLDLGRDSTEVSFIYMHVANAFAQTGFVKESLHYIDRAIEMAPGNRYAPYIKAYILYANNKDMEETKKVLMGELEKDPTRLDIMQEVAKIFYFQRNFEVAHYYYEKYNRICDSLKLDIYPHENGKIALTYEKIGDTKMASVYSKKFRDFAMNDVSLYSPLNKCEYYSLIGDKELALKEFRNFEEAHDFQYWIVLFLDRDPILDPIINTQEFKTSLNKVMANFWEDHENIKSRLQEEGVL